MASTNPPPAPEILQPKAQTAAATTVTNGTANVKKLPRRMTYHVSHKATFIGLLVVAVILAINGGIVVFVLRNQPGGGDTTIDGQVTIDESALSSLGVNRGTVGQEGLELTVNPNARFRGRVEVASDVSIAGSLNLNSRMIAADASLARLEAGDASMTQLSVNGSGTFNSLILRTDLQVAGAARIDGLVTLNQLLTVNNNVNVAGSLAVGGRITAPSLQASILTVDSDLVIGGRLRVRGLAPSVTPGGNLGSNGTVSISGSDAAGTVAVNIGAGGGGGIVATVTFRNPYPSTPRVIISPVGGPMGGAYVNRSATGFSIGIGGTIGPGAYAFDYLVIE